MQNQTDAWRPAYIDGESSEYATADYFNLLESPHDLFNHNQPLKEPKNRASDEEFIFHQAKRRPVILATKTSFFLEDEIKETRKGHKFHHDIWLVVPIYSIINPSSDKWKFHEETIEKARLLYYINLLFLPSYPAYSLRESVARLDYICALRSKLLKPEPIKLSKDVTNLMKEMLSAIITERIIPNGYIENIRSLLANQ
ncbi:MAG: hypothetical protein GF353_07135 [Candidatus Lokiarchaeota archaeon]|nr:hypothetical protein [Candidatus Lokiarchaeota archaeon]